LLLFKNYNRKSITVSKKRNNWIKN